MPWFWTCWLACRAPAPPPPPAPPPTMVWITVEQPGDGPLLPEALAPARRAWLPTRQLQPNLATLHTGRLPAAHGLAHGGHQRLAAAVTTFAERALAADLRPRAHTATPRTRQGQGLHQGFVSVVDHERTRGAAEPSAVVLAAAPPTATEPAFTWLHLEAPDPEPLGAWVEALREAAPEARILVVGLEGQPSAHLDDDALGAPLHLLPDPGWDPSVPVGLPDLHAWATAWLEGRPVPSPTGRVVHHDPGLRALLGGPEQAALTVPDGRYDGPAPSRWHAVDASGHHPALGQPLPREATLHDDALAAALAAPGEVSPRAYPDPWAVRRAATSTPWVLVDPDHPSGGATADQLGSALEAVGVARRALAQRRYRAVDEALQAPGLPGTPAATWLTALARIGEGDLEGAAAVVEEGLQHSSGPTFALLRARIAADALEPEAVLAWVEHAHDLAADPREVESRGAPLLAEAFLVAPWASEAPPRLDAWASHLATDDPEQASIVQALRHPDHPTALEEMQALRARHPHRGDVRLAYALAAWHHGHPTEAEAALRELVRDQPERTSARLMLAHWDEELGRPEEALRLLGVLARRHPDHEALQAWFDRLQTSYGWQERKQRQADRAFNRP